MVVVARLGLDLKVDAVAVKDILDDVEAFKIRRQVGYVCDVLEPVKANNVMPCLVAGCNGNGFFHWFLVLVV